MRDSSVLDMLPSSLLLVSCEGGAERFIFETLLDHGCLTFARDAIRDITSIRSAAKLQETYLGFDYDQQVVIVRLLDSLNESFQLGRLYRNRYPLCSIYTRPEIEILAVIHEGKYTDYCKIKSKLKPSDYCKQALRLPHIKHPDFLQEYWTVDALLDSIVTYKRLHKPAPGELCLADLLR